MAEQTFRSTDHAEAGPASHRFEKAATSGRTAREFDGELPIAGTYSRKAASQAEGVADTIRTGNFKDLVRGAQSFARRQPTAFLGIAVLAGFGIVRFLKSSADDPKADGVRQMGGERFEESTANQARAAADKGYHDEYAR